MSGEQEKPLECYLEHREEDLRKLNENIKLYPKKLKEREKGIESKFITNINTHLRNISKQRK